MRKQVFAANWKMYKTVTEAQAFVEGFLPLLNSESEARIIICPPTTLLGELRQQLLGSGVALGAQNIYWENAGAFTGEISALQVHDSGASFCLCGHSERRQYFGENASMVALKAAAAMGAGLIPIVCVGENLAQRESGQTLAYLQSDILASLKGLTPSPRMMIAYEPVWAIGTGRVATCEDAEEAIAHIRTVVGGIWGEIAGQLSILYGGSVKPDNIASLLACPNIDGALVGGASLSPQSFAAIVNAGFTSKMPEG
ncbi:MAG: triose-phosphate isomerase [Clostridiales bacterium]|nr:triose-phosphate isomerase [Clostridiales bacterium]